ncbi:pre-mRNA-splicing factor RBM22 [Salpingoeca rosetta]|uniref:Pre-mRNA-splicing factor RBM22 n=1 Tax=Salpingoeca rosetta (strain ATCC 50818 / BSB-021) TaxID=946362 RepID=F2UI61_SALR5|nr:pre-mRNA-splicing factor RBM22 [Salpingoeca rosetta]EGD76810.1 pre-mRNA-splicing factor RBM22 [Salpingoeca rosetta]|eukprot:XP_004991182.1 pre-mRNA-splicing factor RBM22 [Salpingoeca rosetta]
MNNSFPGRSHLRLAQACSAFSRTQPLPETAGQAQSAGRAILERLARRTPYYKRNAPHICSFWVKGECKRGDLCPYRHEMPTDPDDPLSKQNMKDRYYGTSDPVAEKMLKRAKVTRHHEAPEDKTITTLYVGGLREDYGINETDIRDVFYQHGEIQRITITPNKKNAFVEYTTREAAERAMSELHNSLCIKGHYLRLLWGRPKASQHGKGPQDPTTAPAVPKVPGLPGAIPLPADLAASKAVAGTVPLPTPPTAMGGLPGVLQPPRPPVPGAAGLGGLLRPPMPGGARMGALYPSMDPSRMGSRGSSATTATSKQHKHHTQHKGTPSSSSSSSASKP